MNPDPKTSRAALIAVLSFLVVSIAQRIGLDLPADVKDGIIFLILAYGLHQARDTQRPAKPKGASLLNRSLASLIAIVLCASLFVVSSTGCGRISRKTIEGLAQGGIVAANVLAANATIPDQLLRDGIIDEAKRDEIVKAMDEARVDLEAFNSGMVEALKSDKPDLKPLIPVALRLVVRINALNRTGVPALDTAFTAAEIGLRIIANYFAIRISELRRAGFTDRQICIAAGVPYDEPTREAISTLFKIANGSGGNHAGATASE